MGSRLDHRGRVWGSGLDHGSRVWGSRLDHRSRVWGLDYIDRRQGVGVWIR